MYCIEFDKLRDCHIYEAKEFHINPESFGEFCNRFECAFDPSTKVKELSEVLGKFYGKLVKPNNSVPLNTITIVT